MNGPLIALGAFLLVLGIGFWDSIIGLTYIGIGFAAVGAGILAWGIGKE
jgi:hypothetical protein